MVRTTLALLAGVAFAAIPSHQAAAEIYRPWCVHYLPDNGTNCGFTSYEQCMWTARSGRTMLPKSVVSAVRQWSKSTGPGRTPATAIASAPFKATHNSLAPAEKWNKRPTMLVCWLNDSRLTGCGMSVLWLYLLPPLAFAAVMFLLFKLLEAAGATSASDFEVEAREPCWNESVSRTLTNRQRVET